MKYARIERERRFLLRDPPKSITDDKGFLIIEDWYAADTRLRLRRVLDESGSTVARKFTQKYRDENSPALQTVITNIYLSDAEFEALRCLGGRTIRKRRYNVTEESRRFAVDVFEGDLAGLVLAEAEFGSDEEAVTTAVPSFALEEVTEEDLFTGGRLAAADPGEFQSELQRRLRR